MSKYQDEVVDWFERGSKGIVNKSRMCNYSGTSYKGH